jgi:hypothetical protein
MVEDNTKRGSSDGILNAAVKVALKTNPKMFLETMNRWLKENQFLDCWKQQKLFLIPKPGQLTGVPSSYRPISLLDTG